MRGRGTSTSYWSSGPPGAAPGFQAKRNSGNLNNFHQQQMQNNSGGSYNYNNYNNLQNMNSAPGGGYNQNNVVGGYQHQGGMGGMGMGHPGSGGQHYPGPGSGSQKSSYFGTSYNQQQQTSSYHQQSSYHPTSSVSYQGHQRTDSYSHNSSGGGYHTTSGGNNPAPGNYHNRTRSWIMTSTTEGEGGQHQKESQLYSSTTSQHGNGSSSGGAAANNRQTGASRRVRGEQHLFVEEAQVVLDLKESRFRARDLERWSDITLTENNLSLDPSSYERVTVNLESNFLGPKGDGVAYFLSKLPLASPSSLVLGTSTSRKSARATVSLAHNGFTTRARDLVLNVIGSGMFVEIDVSHNFFEDDDLIAFVQRAVNCGFYYAGASKNSGASSGGTLLNTPNTNASTNGTPPNVVLDVEQVTGGTRPETSNKNGSTISSATATPGRGVDASDLTTTNPASADESATEQTRGHLTPNKDLQSPTSLTGGTSSEEHGDGILAGTPETSASSNLPDVVEGRTMMAMTAGKSAAGNEDAPTTSTPPPGISTASSGRTLRLRIDSNSPESEVICLQRLRDTFGLQIHLASPSSTIITTTESVSGTATGPTVSDSAVVIIDGRFGQGLPRRPPAMQPESWRASAGSYSGYSSSVHPHSGSAQNGLSSGYSTATGGYNSSSSYGSPGQHHGQQLQHQYQPAGAGVVVQGQQQQHYPGGSQGSAPSSLQGGQQQQQHGPSYGAGSGYHATATPAGYRSDRDMQWRLPPPPPPSGPPPSGPPPPGPPPQQTPMQQAAIQHAPPQLTFTGDDLSRRIAELEANPERRYRGKLKIWNATRQGGYFSFFLSTTRLSRERTYFSFFLSTTRLSREGTSRFFSQQCCLGEDHQ
ncbi:unnamed protein product [Amoebophrya sp. A25]|nr:unnamed protein product [Amoebophrya sp. A25]|eukprot:GSA25T00012811001.1